MTEFKNRILDAMERSLECYTEERIKSYIKKVKKEGLTEHGFPRLGVNLGLLVCNGRKLEYKDYFYKIIELCLNQIPKVKAANEFSIKELALLFLEAEKTGTVEKERLDDWKRKLALKGAMELYKKVYTEPGRLNNWAVFAAASEWARVRFKLNGDEEFVEKQLETQEKWFDENGCYLEPNNPVIYDVVTRQLFCYMLRFGYDGKYKDFLDEKLEKAGLHTLQTLSVNAEAPYGGRSNQFVHNEACYVSLFVHEANRYNERGDYVLAGQFKRAAEKCLSRVLYNLEFYRGRHVKNFYGTDSKIGCESYAYFDKYMITVASNLQLALFYDVDKIEPAIAPFEEGGYIYASSKEFGSLYLTCGDYSVQFGYNANESYDGSGIGRIHKKGAPSAIALSTPFAKEPKYKIPKENEMPFAICPAIYIGKQLVTGAEAKTKYHLIEANEQYDKLSVKFRCTIRGRKQTFNYSVDENGIKVGVYRPLRNAYVCFPVLKFDGETNAEIVKEEGKVTVKYKGYSCEYSSEKIESLSKVFHNRNGEYEGFVCKGFGDAVLRIKIQKL